MSLKKLVAVSLFLLVGAGIVVFAAAQSETAAEEMPVVTISHTMRGMDDSNWDWDYIRENDEMFQLIEEKFKVKLEFPFTAGDYNAVVTGMAAGDTADIIRGWPGHPAHPMPLWRDWINDGLITDMGDLVDKNPGRYPVLEIIFADPVYKIYNNVKNGDPEAYFSIHNGRAVKRAMGGLIYNGFLLRELGLDVPETYDELITAMKAARRDLGISGYGWVSYEGTAFHYMEPNFWHPDGLHQAGFWMDENDEWYDATIDPRNKAKWAELQGYAEEGLFHSGWLTGEFGAFMDDLIAGKHLVGDAKGPSPGGYLEYWNRFKLAYPDATYDDFPQGLRPLKGPKGVASFYNTPLIVYQNHYIPSYSENADRALDILNFTLTEEFQNMRWFGIKGVHYTKDDKTDFDQVKFFKSVYGYHDFVGTKIEDHDPARIEFPLFTQTTNYDHGIVEYEKYGNWYDAQVNVIPMRAIRSNTFYSDKGNIMEVWNNFVEEGWQPLPLWQSFIVLTDEESEIQKALEDIKIKWFVAFLLSNKDVETEWDNFVREYKAAGADRLLAAWSTKADTARGEWEAIVGE